MKRLLLHLLPLLALVSLVGAEAAKLDPIPPIPRRIPAQGIEIPEALRTQLLQRLEQAQAEPEKLRRHPDVDVFRKAVRFALLNGEFYDKKHFSLPAVLLDEADRRVALLAKGEIPWNRAKGRLVRGFRSAIDDTVQPYGLEIPPHLPLNRPVPLYVWLHGRGDKTTDLHFIHQRMNKPGTFAIDDGIVLHPFGRQCIGYKSAGETDVLEAIADVRKRYPVDKNRIVLMGFSMGGAGAWHLGARHAHLWAAVHAGAGFAETARYNRLAKDDYPSWFEQRLWGLHDAPDYVRNLFNLPVVAYSGELDKQKQAADLMAATYAAHGRELLHLVGPGMGHKYDPGSKEKILAFLRRALEQGRLERPATVSLQTRTLRHNRVRWIYLTGLLEHWKDTRADASLDPENGAVTVRTKNVSTFLLIHPNPSCCGATEGFSLRVDDTRIQVPPDLFSVPLLRKPDGTWTISSAPDVTRKKHGLQGPIDDAFLAPFLVVPPETSSGNPVIDRWCAFEIARLQKRWRELFRGELPMKKASEVTLADQRSRHLVLFGSPASNPLIAAAAPRLPVTWKDDEVTAGERTFPSEHHLPILIHPNPDAPQKYLVLNSGPTFREYHDRTNSLQNPKLPDWAVIDLRQPPDHEAPGKIVAADFFDERWRLKLGRPFPAERE